MWTINCARYFYPTTIYWINGSVLFCRLELFSIKNKANEGIKTEGMRNLIQYTDECAELEIL